VSYDRHRWREENLQKHEGPIWWDHAAKERERQWRTTKRLLVIIGVLLIAIGLTEGYRLGCAGLAETVAPDIFPKGIF
jgi:hypothetical protein